MKHPAVIMTTERQTALGGSGLPSIVVPRNNIATGLHLLMSPYIGIFMLTRADRERTQLAA